MATSTGPLQHLVHQAPAQTESHGGVSNTTNEGGMGPPPTLGGGRTISPTTSITPPDASGMAAVNWGLPTPTSPQPEPQQEPSPMVVPTFPTKATGNPVVIASSGIRLDNTVPTTTSTAAPKPKQQSYASSSATSRSTAMRRSNSKDTSSKESNNNNNNNNRRQKRLERNRESARLSRMRRKQYLEVLEDRVNKLSLEMDKGRREHVFTALEVICQKRAHVLQNSILANDLTTTALSRTSRELRVANTFLTQQLQSLSLPTNVKFLLWLMLQNDSFFRGGRAASERLSAARIGERMLTGGNDHVPPSRGMWPLLCNEVGLSYDQEERVRSFQRQLLLTPESWVHRHTGAASKLAMDSTHDCMDAAMHAAGERERGVFRCLTQEQQLKLLQWSRQNADRLARLEAKKQALLVVQQQQQQQHEFSEKYHDAANLYILHHRMQQTRRTLTPTPTIVPARVLKRLSRRPSFESLQSATSEGKSHGKDGGSNRPLAREVSFSSEGSMGSLKRSLDDMHAVDQDDEDRNTVHHVTPEEAQTAAGQAIEDALGFIKELVPPPKPTPKIETAPDAVGSSFVLPSAFKIPVSRQPQQPVVMSPHAVAQQPQQQPTHPGAPATMHPQQVVSHAQPMQQEPQYQYQQQQPVQPQQYQVVQAPAAPTSLSNKYAVEEIPPFLPPNLNVVPEEGFLPNGADTADAEDFLFELTEEDWAIGAGLDMDA